MSGQPVVQSGLSCCSICYRFCLRGSDGSQGSSGSSICSGLLCGGTSSRSCHCGSCSRFGSSSLGQHHFVYTGREERNQARPYDVKGLLGQKPWELFEHMYACSWQRGYRVQGWEWTGLHTPEDLKGILPRLEWCLQYLLKQGSMVQVYTALQSGRVGLHGCLGAVLSQQ